MSAKPKCPKCKQRQLNEIGIASKTHPRIVMCLCGWSRRVSRVAIIRLAVGKPETCKWRYTGMWIAGCGDHWNLEQTPFCPHCGKPVEVKG